MFEGAVWHFDMLLEFRTELEYKARERNVTRLCRLIVL